MNRYKICKDEYGLIEDSEGDLVLYDDLIALIRKLTSNGVDKETMNLIIEAIE